MSEKKEAKKYPRTVKALLLCAADLIEERGLAHGEFEKRGRYCAVGALRECSGFKEIQAVPLGDRRETRGFYPRYHRTETLIGRARDHCEALIDTPFPSLVSFNDHSTKKQVVALLRRAAGIKVKEAA